MYAKFRPSRPILRVNIFFLWLALLEYIKGDRLKKDRD